jgi:membrane-associated phospholipid phosphatase
MDRINNHQVSRNGDGECATVHADCAWPFGGWSPRFWLGASIWLASVALVTALLDTSLAVWVGRTVPVPKLMWLFKIMKSPGNFWFTLLVAAMLLVWHSGRWRVAAFVCMSGMLSGLLCALMKWCVGRTRPLHDVPAFKFQPFRYGWFGLFHGENLSFPSGHACLAFATAASLSVLIPRWRLAFFAGALVVAAERVLQGSHYIGDVVAAAGLGVLSTYVVWWIFDLKIRRPMRPFEV